MKLRSPLNTDMGYDQQILNAKRHGGGVGSGPLIGNCGTGGVFNSGVYCTDLLSFRKLQTIVENSPLEMAPCALCLLEYIA